MSHLRDRLRDWLGVAGVAIRVQPVLQPDQVPAADRYEIPTRLREALRARSPAEVFPWGTNLSRSMDIDHTIPYTPPDRGGSGGQTRLGNLGLLSRSHHRAKTLGGWRLHQPVPGQYLWRSPLGRIYLVTPAGTHTLGNSPWAHAVWHASTPTTSPADTDTSATDRQGSFTPAA